MKKLTTEKETLESQLNNEKDEKELYKVVCAHIFMAYCYYYYRHRNRETISPILASLHWVPVHFKDTSICF